jgi:hypothetical protein
VYCELLLPGIKQHLVNANGTIAILATIIKHYRCAVIGLERDRTAVRALAELPHSAIAYDRTIAL